HGCLPNRAPDEASFSTSPLFRSLARDKTCSDLASFNVLEMDLNFPAPRKRIFYYAGNFLQTCRACSECDECSQVLVTSNSGGPAVGDNNEPLGWRFFHSRPARAEGAYLAAINQLLLRCVSQ